MTTQLMNIGGLQDNRLIFEQFDLFSRKVAKSPKEQRISRKLESEIVALQRFAEQKDSYVAAITHDWAYWTKAQRAHLVEVANRNMAISGDAIEAVKGATPEFTFLDITWWVFNRQRVQRTLEQGRDALLDISDAILSMHESDQGWFTDLLTERLAEAKQDREVGVHLESRGEIMNGGTRSLQD